MTQLIAADELIVHATLARVDENGAFVVSRDAALALRDGRIAWFGSDRDIPEDFAAATRSDLGGRLITPGLVECHTHLVHAGERSDERQERKRGDATYKEQLARGGAIHATVRDTRAATEEELFKSSVDRAKAFAAQGVTTLEIKSGYGMDVATELTMLRVATRIGADLQLDVIRTLLAGHAYPLDGDREAFVEFVCQTLLPAAREAGLMDCVEVCCDDSVGLDLDDASTILETAYRWKVPTRMQADFLADSAGSALAPAFYARAAAHLLNTDALAIKALAASHTAAVLLPVAAYELGLEARPPIEELRKAHVPMAVSSGYNPGTAPVPDLLAAARHAIGLFGLTQEEAFIGITRSAARALGLNEGQGDIRVGGLPDFAIWDAASPLDIISERGDARCWAILKGRRGPVAGQLQRDAHDVADAL